MRALLVSALAVAAFVAGCAAKDPPRAAPIGTPTHPPAPRLEGHRGQTRP